MFHTSCLYLTPVSMVNAFLFDSLHSFSPITDTKFCAIKFDLIKFCSCGNFYCCEKGIFKIYILMLQLSFIHLMLCLLILLA